MAPAKAMPLSEAGFETDLRGKIRKYVSLWDAAPERDPRWPETFAEETQRDNEREADLLIASMEKELRLYPGDEPDQAAWRERQFDSLRRFGTRCLGFPDRHFDIIFSPGYFAATRDFARAARAFDGSMEPGPLAQAMRNVWVMNSLQIFLGRRPSLTPSIFAYSMLYPYTDNHLDSPDLTPQSKQCACGRLRRRLAGRPVSALDEHEAAVFRLVSMIEDEYPRGEFPDVYRSLLAIHGGQVKSLQQQSRHRSPDAPELLGISVEKGGASVLADGWLVAGRLTREDAAFCFGFGVMLQLLDDLQDLPDDRRAGHRTLFTCAAARGTLDALTSRLWNFLHSVLDGVDCRSDARRDLRDLIRRNSIMLLLRAVAESAGCYSPAYLRRMERFSPLGFAFLRDRRGSVERRYRRIWPALARRRNLRSIFDLLGDGRKPELLELPSPLNIINGRTNGQK